MYNSHYLDITYSESGHGSDVYCSYQVGSKISQAGGGYDYQWSTSRVKGDVQRRYNNVYVGYPVVPSIG